VGWCKKEDSLEEVCGQGGAQPVGLGREEGELRWRGNSQGERGERGFPG